MNKQKRLEILTRLRDNNPHPTTELVYTTPFELLMRCCCLRKPPT